MLLIFPSTAGVSVGVDWTGMSPGTYRACFNAENTFTQLTTECGNVASHLSGDLFSGLDMAKTEANIAQCAQRCMANASCTGFDGFTCFPSLCCYLKQGKWQLGLS